MSNLDPDAPYKLCLAGDLKLASTTAFLPPRRNIFLMYLFIYFCGQSLVLQLFSLFSWVHCLHVFSSSTVLCSSGCVAPWSYTSYNSMYAVWTLSILSISRSPVHLPHKNKNLPESPSEKTKVSSSYFPLNLKKYSGKVL
jgi:hypothetical protein